MCISTATSCIRTAGVLSIAAKKNICGATRKRAWATKTGLRSGCTRTPAQGRRITKASALMLRSWPSTMSSRRARCRSCTPTKESPALKYLVKAEPPVKSAPSLSGCVTAIIAPASRLVTGTKLQPGDAIIGVTSSGIHANGISLVIKKALELPEKFLTKLSNGNTLGEETLIPTRSYVALIEALLDADVDIHALLPGTGSGVAKIAFDSRPATYRIHGWGEVPPLMQFMQSIGVSLVDCLKSFNWGMGYYVFVPQSEVQRVLALGKKAGYELLQVGVVEEGERQVIFEPENIVLPPPGE